MPFKLSTTIGKIQNIPNSKNIEIINEFLEYMRSNGSSEHHHLFIEPVWLMGPNRYEPILEFDIVLLLNFSFIFYLRNEFNLL